MKWSPSPENTVGMGNLAQLWTPVHGRPVGWFSDNMPKCLGRAQAMGDQQWSMPFAAGAKFQAMHTRLELTELQHDVPKHGTRNPSQVQQCSVLVETERPRYESVQPAGTVAFVTCLCRLGIGNSCLYIVCRLGICIIVQELSRSSTADDDNLWPQVAWGKR